MKLKYGSQTFLIDPYLSELHSGPSMGGKSYNPTSALPVSFEVIVSDVDFVFISHLHPDHFDQTAQEKLPKNFPIICQPEDQKAIQSMGFSRVLVLEEKMTLGEITLHRTTGEHGVGKIAEWMGPVSGVIFQHENEKSLYWLGDTVFCQKVKDSIRTFDPELIICHAGGNKFFKSFDFLNLGLEEDTEPLIMDADQLIQLIRFTPKSKVMVTHVGALDHETETREGLREKLLAAQLDVSIVFIPDNGSLLSF